MTDRIYEKPLWVIGTINTVFLLVPLPFLFLHLFPETEGIPLFLESIAVAVPVLLMKVTAENVKEKKVRILLGILIYALSILFSIGPVMKTSFALDLLFYLVLAFFAPRPEGRIFLSKPQSWHSVVFILFYSMGQGCGNTSVRNASVVLFVLFLLLFLLDRNMGKVEKRLAETGASSARETILRVNNRLMILFSLLFLLFSLAVPFLLSNVERGQERPIAYVFGEDGAEEETTAEVLRLEERDILVSRKGKVLGGGFFSVFPIALAVLLSLGAVVFVLYALFSLLFSFQNGKAAELGRLEEVVLEEEAEEAVVMKKEAKPNLFSLEGRVRRLYRKRILSSLSTEVNPALSPRELEKMASIEDEILHAVYEKARYSKDGIGEEDLKAVRKKSSK